MKQTPTVSFADVKFVYSAVKTDALLLFTTV